MQIVQNFSRFSCVLSALGYGHHLLKCILLIVHYILLFCVLWLYFSLANWMSCLTPNLRIIIVIFFLVGPSGVNISTVRKKFISTQLLNV